MPENRQRPTAPHKLTRDDVRDGFDSGAHELDEWLLKYAWQNQRAHSATTFVSTVDQQVVGYYAVAVAGIARENAAAEVSKGMPREVPVLLIARLAVDQRFQGRGVGRALLADALHRACHLSAEVGMRAVLIHARDDAARSFYLSAAEFQESPTDPLHLMLTIAQITKFI